jgi:pimeloyl-ACP methyl ester carboxylesterase
VAVASQLRNTPTWFTLIDRAIEPGGLKREFVLGDRWSELSVPTTFVWGEKDAFAGPEHGEALAAKNPRVRMIRVPDAGHSPWFDQPERVVEAIEAALSAP